MFFVEPPMTVQITATSSPIVHVIDRILRSGKITRADEFYFFKAMVAEQPLNSEEQAQVRHVLARLQMGLLQVVD